MFLERSKFDKCNSTIVRIYNSVENEISFCQFSNSNNSGVYVGDGSQLNIYDSTFENCMNDLYSYLKSETLASNCSFRQMRKYSAYCYKSSIIKFDGYELVDPKKSFFIQQNKVLSKSIGLK
jgi:hypothetical protein